MVTSFRFMFRTKTFELLPWLFYSSFIIWGSRNTLLIRNIGILKVFLLFLTNTNFNWLKTRRKIVNIIIFRSTWQEMKINFFSVCSRTTLCNNLFLFVTTKFLSIDQMFRHFFPFHSEYLVCFLRHLSVSIYFAYN